MPDFDLHLLDPGAIEYGDCALYLGNGKSILVDGGKRASARETSDTVLGRDVIHKPIQEQIEALHGSTAIDLLVITHCHSDHIGGLPALIQNGVITCQWALIADPQLGFGIGGDAGPLPPVSQMTPAEKLWLALREEPDHSRTDAGIRQFIEDAAGQYQDYVTLVELLQTKLGDRCVRYRGPSGADSAGLDALLAEFAPTGLRILGPSLKQLGNCAKFLVGRSEDVAAIDHELTAEGTVDLVAAYRRKLGLAAAQDSTAESDSEFLDDTSENGNAVNNQSIVLTLGEGPARALLTADMQLASPQLSDETVKQEIQALRDQIAADVVENGPYGFIKLSHHGATNGHSQAMLRDWGAGLFGISTGSGSSKHPTAPTLAALKSLDGKWIGIQWGRTDVNGCVTYKVRGKATSLRKERGVWNDLTPPARRAGDAGPSEEPPAALPLPLPAEPAPPVSTFRTADGDVEVTVKFPFGKGRVRVTIESEPEDASAPLT